MYLRAVQLRNWRSYRHARLEFPVPDGKRNVILVRAPNEYGKTALFEAITLALFGRAGLPLLPRAILPAVNDLAQRRRISYSDFLNRALHYRAAEIGPRNCAVTLEFEDDEGEPVEIKRTWHFRAGPEHTQEDDDVRIFEGRARRPVMKPVSEIDHEAWYLDFIAQKFIHPDIASFFLFDGEQIQQYAGRGMETQIKSGIEGLLGLRILRSLRESLQKYARARRAQTVSQSDDNLAALQAEVDRLEIEERQHLSKVDETERLLRDLEEEQIRIMKSIDSSGEGTVAAVGELMKEQGRFESEAGRHFETLMNLLASDVALALCGSELRDATVARLRSEQIREEWEAGRGSSRLERYLHDLIGRLEKMQPPISGSRAREVAAAARGAWDALWHPAPDGCAEDYRHSGMRGEARTRSIIRLEDVARHSAGEMATLAERFRDDSAAAEAKKQERLRIEHRDPEIEKLPARLKQISEDIGHHRGRRETALRSVESLKHDLAARRQELGRYVERRSRDKPTIQRARRADDAANAVEKILDEAMPAQFGLVAEAMTKAWKSMAHLDERIERIDITEDCEVRMLNARGENLHVIDKSAGARQIFTQALIWAITHVSGETFPFIVDTPLARLSREQRIGVLKTFLDRSGQVILLSTDQEVVGDNLEAIRDRIAAAYRLNIETEDGVAETTIEKDQL